ncbi:MAG: peptide ABC transporter substrate-binding protein, partial [Dorea sp.]|nr:peptide ABC transporter substrate-binding protein [Dorea sp.]
MKKKCLALLMAGLMAVSMAGCSTPGSNVEKDSGTEGGGEEGAQKVFRYSVTSDVSTLDPQKNNDSTSGTIGYHTGEGLTRSMDGVVHPGLAEEWEVSDDGLTYTFHLRDAKYSDGEKIKAQDFEYAMKRIVDPETASSFAFIAKPLENADEITAGKMDLDELGVEAVDDETLVCKLGFPAPYFLQVISMSQFYPTRKDMVEKYGDEFAADGEKNVYSGPFCLKEWKQNDRIILEKNPMYWDKDKVNLDRVEILIVADENTALAMYEAGELDYVNVPTDAVGNYPDAEFYKMGAEDFIKLNTGDGPLANKNFRLVLNYGLDRSEFIKLSTNDVWEPATRFVLPDVGGAEGTFGEDYPYEAFPLEGDQKKAEEYLNTALKELGIASASDITLELLTSDMERTKKEAEVLQALLQEALGIKITIQM